MLFNLNKFETSTRRFRKPKRLDLNFGILALALAFAIYPMRSVAEDQLPAPCPYAEGQVIEPLSMVEAYSGVNPETLRKGEFETTSEFEDRREGARKLSRFPFPVLANVSSLQRTQHIRYDADQRITYINTDYMLNPSPYFSYALKEELPSNEAPKHFHAIQLGEVSRPLKTRNVLNSAGESIEVVIDDGQYVHVYMSPKAKPYQRLFIGETKRSFGNYEANVVEIPMTIDEARLARRSINFVPIILPRKPYTHWLTYFEEAKIDKAGARRSVVEVDVEMPVIFADISCLAITDRKNQILKIVRANRPS